MKEKKQFIWKESVGYQLCKIQTGQKTDKIVSVKALDYNLCFRQLIYDLLDSCILINQSEKLG